MGRFGGEQICSKYKREKSSYKSSWWLDDDDEGYVWETDPMSFGCVTVQA